MTNSARWGANPKALIFTESRRTQTYLKDFLEANGHAGKVTLFNGNNSGPETKAIYDRWLAKNSGTGRAAGSRDIDSRTAIIEHFRDHADILIATEAAEGVNMQFCSLVVNYDLPWNLQRLEQSNRFFHEERERLERWADDMVLGAEKELSDTKAQLRALGRQARLATTTDEQHTLQLRVRELEKLQRSQRQRVFDVEGEIKDKRDALIDDLEARLVQHTEATPLFTIRWSVV